MAGAIRHRGPDDEGVVVFDRVTLGNRRLSIIDLSRAGHQPMTNEAGTVSIVYNGEVYNFEELKKDLKARKFRFKSNTDTEVILKGYEAYGAEIINKLRGMWAFAIYDASKNKLLLSRDFFGIKPLYYFWDEETLIFASEIKALKEFFSQRKIKLHLEKLALNAYFILGYAPHPLTVFREVKKLSPGETLIFDLSAKSTERKFISWQPAPNHEARDLEQVMAESVAKHLIADVPVGVYLSGGADSTLMALMLKKLGRNLKAFTVRIKKREDAEFAKRIAKFANLDHEEIELDENNFEEMYSRAWEFLDEPLADNSLIPSLLVSKAAAKHVKVVITGEGGDELFLGYDRYRFLSGLSKADSAGAFGTFLDFFRMPQSKIYLKFLRPILRRGRLLRSRFSRNLLLGYLENAAIDGDFASRLPLDKYFADRLSGSKIPNPNFFDQNFYLPDDLLLKTDCATMAFSLEGRVPILDREVFAFANRLPMSEKLNNGVGKKIIKDYLAKNLPQELVFRKKEGFSLPMASYLYEGHGEEIKASIKFLEDLNSGIFPNRLLKKMRTDFSYLNLIQKRFPTLIFAILAFQKTVQKYDISS